MKLLNNSHYVNGDRKKICCDKFLNPVMFPVLPNFRNELLVGHGKRMLLLDNYFYILLWM